MSRHLIHRFTAVLMTAALLFGSVASVFAASIVTDLWVYNDGDTVTVTGTDFGPTETVDLVTTDPNGTVVDSGSAQTDEAGEFAYSFLLVVTVTGIYTVTATGRDSGLNATTQ